jgi:hypothetical protein
MLDIQRLFFYQSVILEITVYGHAFEGKTNIGCFLKSSAQQLSQFGGESAEEYCHYTGAGIRWGLPAVFAD